MADDAGDDEPKATPHFHGHRQRLREKFSRSGANGLADYELLELLLFRALPRRDTKPVAKAIIARFGSFAAALKAPEKLLKEIDGVGEAVVTDFRIAQAAAERILRGEIARKPALNSWSSVLDYCRASMAFADREEFRILFLDKKNVLIGDEVQQIGTVDHTPVYPREVVKRALELSATALILAHNHPSGDPAPSQADITMTRKIIEAAAPFGIAVHDHVIIGKDGHASMKSLRLI